MAGQIDIPACALDERRETLLSPSPPYVDMNGIDFVEVDGSDHRIIRISFLKPLPAGAYGLPADMTRISITGGTRIVGITALAASVESASVLRIDVDEGGDYSPYVLWLDAPELDPVRRSVAFSFMAACPTDVDCRPAPCPPRLFAEPLIDYLAKDYASFRQLMLDLLPTLNPDWVERNPSDLAIALVELLAYVGDRLSYYQDAVANEAYLGTLRMRISARRHTKLVDYRMHDGRNAWAPVHFQVSSPMSLPAGTALFTHLDDRLPGQPSPPGPVIPAGAITVPGLEQNPSLQSVAAFETAFTAGLTTESNEIRIHTWGEEECCLEAGATEAYLYSVPTANTAVRPALAPGDMLVFEEVLGPSTGLPADADPTHRQLVVLASVDDGVTDPLYARTLSSGVPVARKSTQQPLPLLHVRWRRQDALTQPLCLSAQLPSGSLLRNVSVARGNIVLADHGLTTAQHDGPEALTIDGRLALVHGPLTMEIRPAIVPVDPATGNPVAERRMLAGGAGSALPALSLRVSTATDVEDWYSVSDLLGSGPFDVHFVAEIDDDGRALLRFGDDQYGRALGDVTALDTVYRVGNGRTGNVGHDTIAHVAPAAAGASITLVRNPLPARDGTDPETIEHARQIAPQAFHSELFRAVTEEDWVQAAERLPDVASAAATYRWTGSWLTIFIAIDPRDRADLTDLPNGRTMLDPAFEQRIRAFLGQYRLAGYDLELRPPRFVPVDLAVEVCARPGYFRSDVAQAVRDALSNRILPDGSLGFFHPSNFVFGQPLYLSRLYAAVAAVTGVDSVTVRKLVRFGQADAGELERGELDTGPWEIVRLDNDPSFVEHGVLTVTARGGKG
jgi:Baseplate J-like protein